MQMLFCLTQKIGHLTTSDVVIAPLGHQGPHEDVDNLIFNIPPRRLAQKGCEGQRRWRKTQGDERRGGEVRGPRLWSVWAVGEALEGFTARVHSHCLLFFSFP